MDIASDWKVVAPAGFVAWRKRGPYAGCETADREGIQVQNDSACIELKGKNIVAAQLSPSGASWFALSADGDHQILPPSIWGPATPTLRAYGQHYVQLISVADDEIVGDPIRCGFETARDAIVIDWVDDDHIVVGSSLNSWLAVLHVEELTRRSSKLTQ